MRLVGYCCALVGALALLAPSAQAQVEISNWRAQVYDSNATTPANEIDANVFSQAGGHPFIGVTDFSLTGATAANNAATVRVDVPAGLVPNPAIYPACSLDALEAGTCATNTQIGTQQITISATLPAPVSATIPVTIKVPLYNIEIEEDQVSRFGFNPADAVIVGGLLGGALDALGLHAVEIIGGVRDSVTDANPPGAGANQLPADNGLFFTIAVSATTPPVLSSKLTFWGTPGDPAHATEVGQSCITAISPVPACAYRPPILPAIDPDLPFLANPTACLGQKLNTRLIVTSEDGGADSAVTQTPTLDGQEGATGCELVPFSSDFALLPDTTAPDTPTGATATLTVPQQGLNDTDVLTTSHVKAINVTMPPGMTLNPSVANGLEACTDAQFAANEGVPGGDACPDASQVGSVRVETPLLPPLPGEPAGGPDQVGSAYVGQPLAGDMYRLFVTIEGRGNSIRLKGSVRPDPATGQLTASFPDNPQLPFGELAVDFRGGPRAPLATPNDCGPVSGVAQLAPWSGTAPVNAQSDPFEIAGAGCPIGFGPALAASTASTASGAYSPFTVRIARDDRNQFLSRVRVDTPPGLAAKIKGVAKCSSAAAATGACPAATRIGTATTTAGAGSEPYQLSGPVYFTEGYKGAPFGMVVVIRAIAGPYDLGTVVVRQSIFVDPDDAHLSVVSDPLPQILEGVPIRLRNVDVTLDKSGFTYNPTSCGTKSVGGRMHSIQNTVADRSGNLRFDNCARLGFAPKLKLSLTGVRQLTRGKHPGLKARVTQPLRQANISTARVALPKSLALDPANARAVCGFEAGLQAKCPKKTRIGKAVAVSPVLNKKLSGPVYFVQGIRIDPTTGARIRTLPTLLVKLNGEIRINVRATTTVVKNKLVSEFEKVPDAPVTRFDLTLKGGKGGILAATGRPKLCSRKQVATNKTVGHNGKRAAQKRVKMATPCKKYKRMQAKKRKAQQRKRAATRRAGS
jgi:hypothetical protein